MRRSVVNAMSGVSVLVVGVSLGASNRHLSHLAVVSAAPTGIVTPHVVLAPSARPTHKVAPAARRTAKAAVPPRQVAPRTVVAVAPTRAARTATPSPRPTPTPTPTPVTINGQPAEATDGNNGPYGPVQVQIVVRSRRIVQANAIVYPQGSGRDQEINSYAIPQLDNETMQAQSAQIDTVSGATCTSDGYIQSLQSAIDQAHAAGLL